MNSLAVAEQTRPTIVLSTRYSKQLKLSDLQKYPFDLHRIRQEMLAEYMGSKRGVDFGFNRSDYFYRQFDCVFANKTVNIGMQSVIKKLTDEGKKISFAIGGGNYSCTIQDLNGETYTSAILLDDEDDNSFKVSEVFVEAVTNYIETNQGLTAEQIHDWLDGKGLWGCSHLEKQGFGHLVNEITNYANSKGMTFDEMITRMERDINFIWGRSDYEKIYSKKGQPLTWENASTGYCFGMFQSQLAKYMVEDILE